MNPERITLHAFSCSLISGDVEGNIKAFFGKVQGVLTKSGPFDVRHQTFMYEARCESNSDSVPLRQMLLCVGSFFANTSACREEWARYVDGKEQGTYVYRMVTSNAHIVFIVSVIYGVPYIYFELIFFYIQFPWRRTYSDPPLVSRFHSTVGWVSMEGNCARI